MLFYRSFHHSENARLERFRQAFPAVGQFGQPGIFLRQKRPIARHTVFVAMRFRLIYQWFCNLRRRSTEPKVAGSTPAGRIFATGKNRVPIHRDGLLSTHYSPPIPAQSPSLSLTPMATCLTSSARAYENQRNAFLNAGFSGSVPINAIAPGSTATHTCGLAIHTAKFIQIRQY